MAYLTTRQLTAPIKISHPSIFQIVCVAPVRDSFEWVNATLDLHVIGEPRANFEFRHLPWRHLL
jgi:hypothetical protein